MKSIVRLLLLSLSLAVFQDLFAQETTATFRGTVTNAKGELVSGASIIVKMESTGFQTGTQTNNKGIFVIPNLKPGGPYTIIISFIGTDPQTFENINLSLGNNPELNVSLKGAEKNLEEVVLNTARRPNINGISISRSQINTL